MRVAGTVAAALRGRGHDVAEGRSEHAGHVAELAGTLGAAVDRVVVLGGDGSLREAALGLLRMEASARPDLGVLAFGSGNVVARELGVPLEPERAAESMARTVPVPWDVGYVRADGADEPEVFLAMLGIGYDAAVSERVAAARASKALAGWYRRRRRASPRGAGALGLVRSSGPRFRIDVDGERLEERAVSAVVSNSFTYGKGMSMSPSASPIDGSLDLHWRSSALPWVTATALIAAQCRRSSPSWAAKLCAGASFRFETSGGEGAPGVDPESGLRWQLDGDPMPRASRLDVTLEPSALRLLCDAASGLARET